MISARPYSAESKDLIQIQNDLQDPSLITLPDLMKYANGSNPEVPPFLALLEMNRRKHIQETGKEFAGPQGTIKDQIIGESLGQPANPTQAPAGINPAAAQPMVNPGASPMGVNPAAGQPMVDPTQMQRQVDPTMMAAQGGLMSLPVNMFKTQSYAGGGIVAFGDPALNTSETQLVKGNEADEYVEVSPGMYKRKSELPQLRPGFKLGDMTINPGRTTDEVLKSLPGIKPLTMQRPEQYTLQQLSDRQKEIDRLAGVSNDPYKDVREQITSMEDRQKAQSKDAAYDRLMAQLESFSTADPSRGFSYGMASSSKAGRELEKEQNKLRDDQEKVILEYRKNMAKEEDARAKGNATAITAAEAAMKKNQFDYAALERQEQELGLKNLQAAATISGAEATQAKLPVDIYNAESQRKNNENMAQYYKRMADAASLRATNKEDPLDKLLTKVERLIQTDSEYKSQLDLLKSGLITPESPEYYAALRRMDAVRLRLLRQNQLEDYYVPRDIPEAPPTPEEKPGFFQGLKGIFSKPATDQSAGFGKSFAVKPIKLD
jgi:hypothetical protein